VEFLVVYQREPHARRMAFQNVPIATTFAERLALAERTCEEFDLGCDMLVDGMDDPARALFGDQPNSLVVVGLDRVARFKQPWADPDELEESLPQLLDDLAQRLLEEGADAGAPARTRAAARILARRQAGPGGAPPEVEDLPRDLALLLRLSRFSVGGEADAELLQDAAVVFAEQPLAHAAFLATAYEAAARAPRSELGARILERLEALGLVGENGARGWIDRLRPRRGDTRESGSGG
jgi:hypothetical protein